MTCKLLTILFLFLSTSCATVINRKHYPLVVYSNASEAKAIIKDSVYDLPVQMSIRRSKKDLGIKLMYDSISQDYTVRSSLNGAFLYGNLLWFQVAPAAYLIDFTNQKRFYYGNFIFLDVEDTNRIIRPPVSEFYYKYYSRSFPISKSQINLFFSFPWVNSFYLQPKFEEEKINTGFWGISAGIEYYYTKNKYFALSANAVMDFFIPFPAAVDRTGGFETMNSVYLSITDNIKYRRFTIGYGLNYSRNNWAYNYIDRWDPPPPVREPVSRSGQAIGFTFNGYHQFTEQFFVGLIYRPSLLKVKPAVDLKYEHLISLDFAWKIKVIN